MKKIKQRIRARGHLMEERARTQQQKTELQMLRFTHSNTWRTRERLRAAKRRNRDLRKQKNQQNAKRRQWEAYVRRKEAEEAQYIGWRDVASHFWRVFDEYRRAST